MARWFRQAAHHLHARILPVRLDHIDALQKLPVRHRDPFDRLLIAQTVAGQLALLTPDEAVQSIRRSKVYGTDRQPST